MAETNMIVRWPDGETTTHYCPSHVVKKFLAAGQSLSLAEFLPLSRQALETASDRVKANFGYPCGRAAAAIRDIERKARDVPANSTVRVDRYDDF